MQVGTRSVVADNSGARRLKVIKVLRKSPLSRAKLKDPLVGSVLRINNRKKYKVFKGAISRAMVIRSADNYKRKSGEFFRFQKPGISVVSKKGVPRSTKIYGPVPKELREQGLLRIISLSSIAL